jgi:ribosomal protein S18 acetylase RimI-like enzyme
MLLIPAAEADYPAIIDLANLAYRGTGASASWNVETGIIEGQRLTDSLLREDLAKSPKAHLLTWREQIGGLLLGCVWLEPTANDAWYLGLLAIQPQMQKQHLGRQLLTAAEDFARERGGRRIRMTVLSVRDALIAWYERRGYALTGETQPYPYGDERFGTPLRDDLSFAVLEKDI